MNTKHTSEVTNITELAYCLSGETKAPEVQRVRGVGMLLPGETYEQALARREETSRRIAAKIVEQEEAKVRAAIAKAGGAA